MDNVNFTLALLQVSGNLSFLDKHYTALINDERIKRHRRAKELEYIFASLQNVTRQLNTFVEEQFEMFFQAPIQTPDEIDEENLKDVCKQSCRHKTCAIKRLIPWLFLNLSNTKCLSQNLSKVLSILCMLLSEI